MEFDEVVADKIGMAMASHMFAAFLNTESRGPKFEWETVVRMSKGHAEIQVRQKKQMFRSTDIEECVTMARASAESWLKYMLNSAGFLPQDYIEAGIAVEDT